MKYRFILPLLLIIMALLPYPTNAAASILTKYEYYSAGGTANVTFYGATWTAQTFTTNASVAHSVLNIKLPLKRVGLPGYVTCSLRETSSGSDLFSYTVDGDAISATDYEWTSFTSTPALSLSANTTYSIVIRAPTATGTTKVAWATTAAGGIAGGNEFSSTDSGLTWVDDAPIDALFEIWGYPTLNVISANIFKDYLATGDWMVMASVDNTLAPYYINNADPGAYTVVQLVNNAGTVVAASPCKFWDRQPIAVYLSPAAAVAQTWGGTYTVRVADVAGLPYSSYSIQSADWRGTNKVYIDSWIQSQALDYQIYYSATLLTTTADGGLVLNDVGKVMFVRGIPQITTVRPSMFQIAPSQSTTHTARVITNTYELGRDYNTELGPVISGILEDMTLVTTGNVTTNNVKGVGSFFLIAVYLVLAITATASISAWAGIALGVPILLLGGYFGILDLSITAIIGSMMAFLLIYQLIWSKA